MITAASREPRIVATEVTDDAIARRLRLRAHDAEFLTDDAIEQRRLSRIRFSGNGDDSSARHEGKGKGERGKVELQPRER